MDLNKELFLACSGFHNTSTSEVIEMSGMLYLWHIGCRQINNIYDLVW